MVHIIHFILILFLVAYSSAHSDVEDDTILACGDGQPLHLNGSQGTITSPGYRAGKYPPNAICSWALSAPEGQVVFLEFEDFELQSSVGDCVDVLLVLSGTEPLQGDMDFSRLEAYFCGYFLPVPFYSAGREILLFFGTNFDMEFRGFKLRYSFTEPKEECQGLTCRNDVCVSFDTMCNGIDDCGDGTDEENCGYPLKPYKGCGRPQIPPNLERFEPAKNRIVGGSAAEPGSWPWQVQLRLHQNHACGATLLNEQFILTAAHCFKSSGEVGGWTVHLGKYGRDSVDPFEQVRYMADIYIHPNFSGPINGSVGSSLSKANDIAVVRLNAPVSYGPWLSPVCMPSSAGLWTSLDTPKVRCYVTGWGDTQGTGSWDVLKQAMVPVILNRKCKRWYEGTYVITDTMMCAGYKEGGTDSCKGDSGGPLVTQYYKRWYLVGVVSHGDQCALPKKPGVYTRVSNYEKWITRTIEKSMEEITRKGSRLQQNLSLNFYHVISTYSKHVPSLF